MKSLSNRCALVTGASRGIGLFIAEALAKKGVHLALAARDEVALSEHAKILKQKYDVRIETFPTDVSDLAQLDRLFSEATDTFGGIDILVNNAAVERAEVFQNARFEDISRDLDVNVRAVLYLAYKCLPNMLSNDCGHIVNVASLAGLGGYPHGESYTTTKHAVVGFTRSLRSSLATQSPNVSASCVCPGYVSNVGMFARKVHRYGVRPPSIMGQSSPESVAHAVIDAITKNKAEVIVNPRPIRPFLALSLLFPHLGEWLRSRLGVDKISQIAATEEKQSLRDDSADSRK